VCGFYRTHNKLANIQEIQIFGHRNNNDVPIKINDMCYNVCGFPEYGGTLKALKMYKYENTIAMEEIYEYNKVFSKEGLYHAMSKYPNRFPIDSVETMVGAMRHSKYINEHEFGHISSFNFTKGAFYDDIWDGTTTKSRGLFINTHTNKIVARSYNKFFNLGQHECSTIDKFEAPITLYKKYDGFLGIIGYDAETDSLVFCSKSTIAPYGDYANLFESKIRPLIKDEQELKRHLKEYNFSLVFECIAPKEDEHLIKYKEDMCILLEVIHNTIEYKNERFSVLNHIAQTFFNGIQVKEYVCKYETVDFFTDDIDTLKSHIGFEGFVAVDKNNQMFKLKTYEFEKLKFIRTQKDYYTTIKQKAGNHEIKKPDKDKFEKRYEQIYDRDTIDEAYKEVCEHIDILNLTYQEK
jgi:tRNA splicing ligase